MSTRKEFGTEHSEFNSSQMDMHVHNKKEKVRIVVQVHLFYLDLLDEVISNLQTIPFSFDCFVSTDTEEKKWVIEKRIHMCNMRKLSVDVFPNIGRDVMPLLLQVGKKIQDYEYFCHIHTKKGSYGGYGALWRKYLYKHLLGNEQNVKHIIQLFEDNDRVGLIYPHTYPLVEGLMEWGGNYEGVKRLNIQFGIKEQLKKIIKFPAGDMFWARTDAISDVFLYNWKVTDFPQEKGQIDATIMHQIERFWDIISEAKGYKSFNIFNCYDVIPSYIKLIGIYALTSDKVSDAEIRYINTIKKYVLHLIVLGNVSVKNVCGSIDGENVEIIIEEKKHDKFEMWKQALRLLKNKDNIEYTNILLASSGYELIGDIGGSIASMCLKNVDICGLRKWRYGIRCFNGINVLSWDMVVVKKAILDKILWEEKMKNLKIIAGMREKEKCISKNLKKTQVKASVIVTESEEVEQLFSRLIREKKYWQLSLLGLPII